MNKMLNEILQRAEEWPEAAKVELSAIAHEIESELMAGVYSATGSELAGIDRGLADAEKARFATEGAVEAVFKKHRR
ncbi:MAG: hypothetical protein GY798_20945 [Hyphomicrobiales bacterium]|nr:hypothetical protein [Hyphomicrobiales bacterium]